jgi:hypothetical protein
MKSRLRVLPMLLCLSVVLTSSNFLTQRVAADNEDTEHITLSEPVRVGGTMLEADTYKLVWVSTGAQVKVSFMKGSKTVATALAKLVMAESAYDGAVETKALGDNTRVLEKITWKKKALIFEPAS